MHPCKAYVSNGEMYDSKMTYLWDRHFVPLRGGSGETGYGVCVLFWVGGGTRQSETKNNKRRMREVVRAIHGSTRPAGLKS